MVGVITTVLAGSSARAAAGAERRSAGTTAPSRRAGSTSLAPPSPPQPRRRLDRLPARLGARRVQGRRQRGERQPVRAPRLRAEPGLREECVDRRLELLGGLLAGNRASFARRSALRPRLAAGRCISCAIRADASRGGQRRVAVADGREPPARGRLTERSASGRSRAPRGRRTGRARSACREPRRGRTTAYLRDRRPWPALCRRPARRRRR
jgi:hypothetical protein